MFATKEEKNNLKDQRKLDQISVEGKGSLLFLLS